MRDHESELQALQNLIAKEQKELWKMTVSLVRSNTLIASGRRACSESLELLAKVSDQQN